MFDARRKRAPAAPDAETWPELATPDLPKPELPLAELPEQARAGGVRLDVSAQLLTLEPGIFSVELQADDAAVTETGMVLPAARLDPLPPGGEGRAYLSTLSDTQLLLPGSHPSFLRVVGGRAPVLLTIYKLTGAPAPRLRINAVRTDGAAPKTPAAAPRDAAMPSLPLTLIVHAAGHGDLRAEGGVWAQAPDGAAPIEGFSILPQGVLDKDLIEYQAILGQNWVSPWLRGGEFCGSRQLALAILGARVRLCGDGAKSYRCQVWGRFDGAEVGPFEAGDACEMNGAALQGLRVVVTERGRGKR
jgi:hypothetical protein